MQEDENYFIETGIIVNNNINSYNEIYIFFKRFDESYFININVLSLTEHDAINVFKN